MKKIIALLMCAVFALSLSFAVCAEDGPVVENGTLKIINYNVAGLPLPSFLSPTGHDPLACSQIIPIKLNECDADIIAVQEDFNFHTILKNRINMRYRTFHLGGVPVGDGLNFYSRLPLYNVKRVAWDQTYGVFDGGSDSLTPKGFLCSSIEIAEGVFIDVYDLHANAYGGPINDETRVVEFKQLLSFVETHSEGRAVIITGDTNTRFMYTQNELKKQFIDEAGFKEAWIELEHDGNYDVGYDENAVYGDEYWGIWDSVEKLFYRDGGGVSFDASEHQYVLFTDENDEPLSDHSAELVTLIYSIDRSKPQDSGIYKREVVNPYRTATQHAKYFLKALCLIFHDLPKLFSGLITISF